MVTFEHLNYDSWVLWIRLLPQIQGAPNDKVSE